MTELPFHRRYPALAADFASFFADRDADEQAIVPLWVQKSSPKHLSLVLDELNMMINSHDTHPDEIQDWANIWLNDNEEKVRGWVIHLREAVYKQAIETYGDKIMVSQNNIPAATGQPIEKDIRLAISCMDLTSLNDDDDNDAVRRLCAQAYSQGGKVAAVCVYPQFILAAKQALKVAGAEDVHVATVTNFPHGLANIDIALRETSLAIGAGADEVDLVFPYQAWLNGDKEVGIDMVKQCKALCQGHARLKVIIETGMLKEPEIIRAVSVACIRAGADFIKTSTGKVPVNATLEAAEIMLSAIKEENAQGRCGFKAAGGVRTANEARDYLNLARNIMGEDWVTAQNFRFGASSLLGDLLEKLGYGTQRTHSQY